MGGGGARTRILLCAVSDRIASVAMRAVSLFPFGLSRIGDAAEALKMMSADAVAVIVVGGASTLVVAESCRMLRSASSSSDAVILALARDPSRDVSLLLDAGADDFFIDSPDLEGLQGSLLVAERTASRLAVRRQEARVVQDSLSELSESLATTLNSIGDGVIATDLPGAILRMNPVAEQLTGWTFAEAKGRLLSEVLPLHNAATHQKVENPTDRALREGAAVSLERGTVLERRDGTELPIADSCAPVRRAGGAVIGAVLVFRDISIQQASDATHATFQRQLVLADRLAAVGTLAAGVAHEINNPLSVLVANVELALELISAMGGAPSARTDELEVMLREAREGAARVTKIVRSLKTFSRVEEERPEITDIIPVLELAITMASNEIRHRARLIRDYGSAPFVKADGARLGQVFINLLINAAQSFRVGTTAANEIRVITSTDGSGRAVVEIRDSGQGIPPELVSRIFDPFFTTKGIGAGTGLGLAISHNIVASMGGEILVQSRLGQGASFRVILPASSSSESPTAPPRAVPVPHSVRRALVLVVDDEPSVGFAIRRVLRGHDVETATTAPEALGLLAQGKEFDVILSDLMMPGMSGMELYAEISHLHPKLAPRVVFLTGGAFTPEANSFLDRIENERMDKPFESRKLRELVEKYAK
jgi:PAS domain S-box-containing protein